MSASSIRIIGLRVAAVLSLTLIARPVSADLYSMFVMSLEVVVDASDVILMADAVPHGQKFELHQKETLRNLTELPPWPLHGVELLTDRTHEGHLSTRPVLLFARMNNILNRLELIHHVWLTAPDESMIQLPDHELIHCMPHSDSGACYHEFRWPVCLAVDARRRLLSDPVAVLRVVHRRLVRGLPDPRPEWEVRQDRWHTFGYETYKHAVWLDATEFDGDDTVWNILLPDDDSTRQLVEREADAGQYRYSSIRYLKERASKPANVAMLRRGLRHDTDWVRQTCALALAELGIGEDPPPEDDDAPIAPMVALLTFATLVAALACDYRLRKPVRH